VYDDLRSGIVTSESQQVEKPYLGTNAFGVKKLVSSRRSDTYEVVFSNGDEFPSIEKAKDEYGLDVNRLVLNISMAAKDVTKAKRDLRALIVCSLEEPFAFSKALRQDPTIENPIRLVSAYHYIYAQLLDVAVYDSTTGEVVARLKKHQYRYHIQITNDQCLINEVVGDGTQKAQIGVRATLDFKVDDEAHMEGVFCNSSNPSEKIGVTVNGTKVEPRWGRKSVTDFDYSAALVPLPPGITPNLRCSADDPEAEKVAAASLPTDPRYGAFASLKRNDPSQPNASIFFMDYVNSGSLPARKSAIIHVSLSGDHCIAVVTPP
jgi:hypothetical protein